MDFAFFDLPRMGKSQTLRHGSSSHKAFGLREPIYVRAFLALSASLSDKKPSAPNFQAEVF